MLSVNFVRIFAGGFLGLLTDLVLKLILYGVGGRIAPQMMAGSEALGQNAAESALRVPLALALMIFTCHLVIVWLYALIRPRFAAWFSASAAAAIGVWLVNVVVWHFFLFALNLFTLDAAIWQSVIDLFTTIGGAVVSATVYGRAPSSSQLANSPT
jgi:hypothetical protein